MNKAIIGVGSILALFSTAVMSYISMATPIGPWIAPTLILCGLLFFSYAFKVKECEASLVYVTIAGSIGGILATAFGFTFPTLYFLDAALFNQWMAQPVYFASVIAALACASGWYGMWIANLTEHFFLEQIDLSFPISQMMYKMIVAQKQIKKAWEMAVGFVGTVFFCMLQDGIFFIRAILPKALRVCSAFSYYCFSVPIIRFDLWPMLWAIGFVTGHMIVVPLLIGSISKMLIVQPMHTLWFSSMTLMEFVLAFCSGMVLSGVLGNLMPHKVARLFKKRSTFTNSTRVRDMLLRFDEALILEGCLLGVCIFFVLSYFGFSVISQIYLTLFTFVCTYQIIMIAGKVGLAQLGRFATFVLVPALFIFNLDVIQITVISTFVEASAGVATDILFGRKVVQLSGVDRRRAKWYQYVGLLISCLAIGIIFWLLINHFGLGSAELFAQRSQARQLLIDVKQFDYVVVLLGILFGFLLKKLRLSPMLVLGGLLMPLNITIGLVFGGLLSLLSQHKEEWYPFWSGVFAANSIWMLLRAMM